MVHRELTAELSRMIPSFALMDFDPHGIEIYMVYKYGSTAMQIDVTLKSPSLFWLGLHFEDICHFNISQKSFLSLSDVDVSKAESLLKRIEDSRIKLEVESMHSLGFKLELESLSSSTLDFISSKYLPVKLLRNKWI